MKLNRPDIIIDTKEIIEEIPLPSPFGRVVTDEMREISDRLDQGVKILAGHTGILNDQSLLLKGINDNLDNLPERIAKALKN